MKQFLKNSLLAGAIFLGSALFAEEMTYEQCYDKVATEIKRKEWPPNSLDKAKWETDLKEIHQNKQLSKDEKKKRLIKEFPKVFPDAPLIVSDWCAIKFHSFKLGHYVTDKKTTKDVFQQISDNNAQVDSEEEDKTQKIEDEIEKQKRNLDTEAETKLEASYRPGIPNAKASMKLQASGGLHYGKNSSKSEVRSLGQIKRQKRSAANKLSAVNESIEIEQKSDFHLSFTLSIDNNSNEDLTVDWPGNHAVPVYINGEKLGDGELKSETVTKIGSNYSKDFDFILRLDKTQARKLVSRGDPTADIRKTNLKLLNYAKKNVIQEQRKNIETTRLNIRVSSLNEYWNIRRRHTLDSRPVKLREALKAVGEDIKEKTGGDPFEWQKDKLVKLFDVPIASFDARDKNERYVAFLQIGDDDPAEITETRLDHLFNSVSEVTLWVIDMENPKDHLDSPPKLRSAIFKKIKSLAEGKNRPTVKLHQFRLGMCYEFGIGSPKDLAKAESCYKKASSEKSGLKEAQFALGNIYYNKGDYSKAVDLFYKAAEQGFAPAQNRLGECYAEGKIANRKDYDKAAAWYQKAVKQDNNAKALFNLGRCYENGWGVKQSLHEAANQYVAAAKQGLKEAQNKLGDFYLHGWGGIPTDKKNAVRCYLKAAAQEYPEAMFNLGSCNANGWGVKQKDEKNAVIWYREAAKLGYAPAKLELGECYEKGKGVPKDYSQMVNYYREAANRNNVKAMYKLAECYENGKLDENQKGVNKVPKEAADWYHKATELNYAPAMLKLGECYENATGVPRDFDEALKWYLKARDVGDKEAQKEAQKAILNLCKNLTEKGDEYFKSRKYKDAVDHYRKAADLGYGLACVKLGNCYRNEQGVGEIDKDKRYKIAAEWYSKAAGLGTEDGKTALNDMKKDFYSFGNAYYEGKGV